jgi:hypothetical protein
MRVLRPSNSKIKKWSNAINLGSSLHHKHLTIFLPFFLFFAAFPLRIKAEKRPKEGGWGGGGKKEGEGPRFFLADRTPDIVFRSLFGFGIVEFGIAA